jgi:hypothetical protein
LPRRSWRLRTAWVFIPAMVVDTLQRPNLDREGDIWERRSLNMHCEVVVPSRPLSDAR